MSVRQSTQEPVSTFYSRFPRTLLQLNGAQDGILPKLTIVTWFHEGLRAEFQIELECEQPSTFSEAVHSAEKAERIWKRDREQSMALADPDGGTWGKGHWEHGGTEGTCPPFGKTFL